MCKVSVDLQLTNTSWLTLTKLQLEVTLPSPNDIHPELMRIYKPNQDGITKHPVDLSTIPDPGPVKYLIEDFIPEGYPTSLYGDGGQGKSYIAMHIARCVITGHAFLGKKIRQHGNVLYLDWELDTNTQRHRWGEVALGCGLPTIPAGLYYQRMEGSLQSRIIDVYTWIAQYKPVLVMLDSVGRASGTDPLDHGKSIEFLTIVETLGTSLLIDHQSKPSLESPYASKREFGSSYKGHYVRCSWQVERIGEGAGCIGLVFRHKKTNFGALLGDIHATLTFRQLVGKDRSVELVSASGGQEVSSTQFGIRGRILALLGDNKMTTEQLSESIPDVELSSIRNEITALKRSGLVIEAGRDGRSPILTLITNIDPRFKLSPPT